MKQTFLGVLILLSGLLPVSAAEDDAFQTSPKGVRYRELQAGQGKPAETGDVVSMHFVGWLAEDGQRGREIYNSRSEGRPVSFVVGTERVMPGWNEGVLGLQAGGRRLLVVPPALAYGKRRIDGVIPPESTLMFVIELLSVEPSGR